MKAKLDTTGMSRTEVEQLAISEGYKQKSLNRIIKRKWLFVTVQDKLEELVKKAIKDGQVGSEMLIDYVQYKSDDFSRIQILRKVTELEKKGVLEKRGNGQTQIKKGNYFVKLLK